MTRTRAALIAGLVGVLVWASQWLHPWLAATIIGACVLVGIFSSRKQPRNRRRSDRKTERPTQRMVMPPTSENPILPATAPQRRFDTSVLPTAPQRALLLATSAEPIDWKGLRQRQERDTGRSLTDLLDITRRALGCATVALALPGKGNTAVLRAWSSDREGVIPGLKIEPGVGLLGQLLKSDAPATLLERELSPANQNLGFYDPPQAVSSIAAVRVTIQGHSALAIADHDQPLHESVLNDLSSLAHTADLLLDRAAQVRSEMRARELWQALGRFERAMGGSQRDENTHEELRQFLLQFLGADAIFLLMPESLPDVPVRPSDRWQAKVQWTLGTGCESAREFRFDVPGRSICAGALARGEFLQRRISNRELNPFLGMGEPLLPVAQGGEILCLPISLGVEGRPAMLAAFTTSAQGFSPVQKEVLETALSSYGQALTRVRANRELEKLATRDGLTGLLNHRTFQSSFRRELLKARRTNSCIALFLTDIDFFKKVNDQHGHPAGDTVLRHVAQMVQKQLREEIDIVARYGGEEFACVLVGTTEEGALETAERIRAAIESSPCDVGEPTPLGVTISIGVAIFPTDGGTAEELIERTDQALYRAKHGGRNRVERALSPSRRLPD